jgi:hypothetical protein
LHLKPEVS